MHVESDNLTRSSFTKPAPDTKQSPSKSLCIRSYCCYDQNNLNDTFSCQEQNKNQSNECKNILSSCRTSPTNICHIDKNNTWCRIDRICANEPQLNCSIQSIDTTINAMSSTTTVTVKSSITTLPSTLSKLCIKNFQRK